jgi:hypothetical protein
MGDDGVVKEMEEDTGFQVSFSINGKRVHQRTVRYFTKG